MVVAIIAASMLMNVNVYAEDTLQYGQEAEVQTDSGDYKISIDKIVETDQFDNDNDDKTVKVICVDCIIENIDYKNYDNQLNAYNVGTGEVSLLDDDGISAEFYDVSTTSKDGYEFSAEMNPGEKKRVALPFFVPKDTKNVTVKIDSKYEISQELGVEDSEKQEAEQDQNNSELQEQIETLKNENSSLKEENAKLKKENKKLKSEKNTSKKEKKSKETAKETPTPEPTEAPAEETPTPEATIPEPAAEAEVPASSATSIKAADNQDTSTIASDEETTYQEALNYAKEKFNYSKASELLKTIKDYKDSNERADLYDKMGDTRFINGHFYWYRDEYIELLKSNLPAMNDTFTDIQLTSSYSEPRNRITYCTDNITISYDAGDVTVTLCNGPFDEGYYDKIEINGAKKTLVNPAILTIGLARCDNDLGEATSIFKKVISEKNENGKYEYIEDGIKYSFEQNDSLMKFTLEQATTSETTIEAEDSNSNTTYNKVLRGYEAIKNNLEDPDSMKVLGVKEHDSDYVFKYTTTNMYGGTVTEYSMYSHGEIADGEEIQWIAKSYYNSEKSNEINWDEVVKYSQSSAYSGNSIEN